MGLDRSGLSLKKWTLCLGLSQRLCFWLSAFTSNVEQLLFSLLSLFSLVFSTIIILCLFVSASLCRWARKINCPAVFRACWATTTKWKSQLVTPFQNLIVNHPTARLPLRRSRVHLCLVGTSGVAAAARAVSGPLLAPQRADLHPSPRNAQDSRAGTAARGATEAAAATVAREGRCGKKSQVNTAEVPITRSHTCQVRQRAL